MPDDGARVALVQRDAGADAAVDARPIGSSPRWD